jgi:hypothetical protein
MVEASKKRIAEAIRTAEEHSQRTKRLDPYAQAQLDQELLNLKSKEGTPLVTKVKEIDTDTEDEE